MTRVRITIAVNGDGKVFVYDVVLLRGMRCPQRVPVLSEFGEIASNSGRFAAEYFDYMRGLPEMRRLMEPIHREGDES